jgi:(2Fe-2S) ferredoxin
MPNPKYHILVCTNSRPPGHPKPSCGAAGSQNILMGLNMGLMERGFQPGEVLVTGSTCLGPCEQGPTVLVYPDGTWYSQVKESDVTTILDEHIKKGQPVSTLNPDSVWE